MALNLQNLRPFPKGHKFGGRKKGSISFSTRLRNALENTTLTVYDNKKSNEPMERNAYDQMIANLIAGACTLPTKECLPFIKEILDRDQGKPIATIEQNTNIQGKLNTKGVPDEYLEMLLNNNPENGKEVEENIEE